MERQRSKLTTQMDLTLENILSDKLRPHENQIYEPLYKYNNKILYVVRGSFRTMSYPSIIEHHKKLSKKISELLELEIEYLFLVNRKHKYSWNLTNNQLKFLNKEVETPHILETIENIVNGQKFYYYEYDSDSFDRKDYPGIQIDVFISEFLLNCVEEVESSESQYSFVVETRCDCITNINLKTIDLERIYVMYDIFIMCNRKNYDLVKSLKLMVDNKNFSKLVTYHRENNIWFGDDIYYKIILRSFGIEPSWLAINNVFVRPYGGLVPFPCHEIPEEIIKEIIFENSMSSHIYLQEKGDFIGLDVVDEIAVFDLNDNYTNYKYFFNSTNIYPGAVYQNMCENFNFNLEFMFLKHIRTYIKLYTFFHKAYSEKNYKASIIINNTVDDVNYKLNHFIETHNHSQKIIISNDFIFVPHNMKTKFYFITHYIFLGKFNGIYINNHNSYSEIYRLFEDSTFITT